MKKKFFITFISIIAIFMFSFLAFSQTNTQSPEDFWEFWLNASKNTEYEEKQFDILHDDYESIVKYLITNVIANYPNEDDICLLFQCYNIERPNLCIIRGHDYDLYTVDLDISDEIAQSLINISESFVEMGRQIDSIRIENGVISFTTIDGTYSLTYEIDKKSDMNKARSKTPYTDSEKLKGKWKHTAS